MPALDQTLDKWEEKAGEVVTALKAMGNERRLIILCQLAAQEEMQVGALVEALGMSQSALSQHLARMRAEDLLATRREGHAIWYRIKDKRLARLMESIYAIYCADGEVPKF